MTPPAPDPWTAPAAGGDTAAGDGPWTLHLLAELLSVFAPDRPHALRTAVDRIVEAVDAEVGAVLVAHDASGPVTCEHAIGVVGAEAGVLTAARRDRPARLPLAAGDAHLLWLSVDDTRTLVIGRIGRGFDAEEAALLRAMARSTALGLRLTDAVLAERSARGAAERHAAQSAGLLLALQERNRLLDRLAVIQRQISVRAPLAEVLELIVEGLADSVPGATAACYVDDGTGPAVVVCASEPGPTELSDPDHPVRRAVRTNRLAERTTGRSVDTDEPEDPWVGTTLAAPVLRDGHPVGALLLRVPDDHAGDAVAGGAGGTVPRSVVDTLGTFAEHASLAFNDASARAALDDALEQAVHQAHHDPLTGLPNRTRVIEQLEQILRLRQAVGGSGRVTVFFVDVDRFKQVNDAHGHAVGDLYLREVGRRLRHHVREEDVVGRLAGDEFVVISGGLSVQRSDELAERLVRALSAPLELDGRILTPSVSVGVARAGPGDDAEALLTNADLAMYRAKERGRNRFERFDRSMRDAADRRATVEGELRRALERDELLVHLQPIAHLPDGRITGFEALIRWDHPGRGLLSPFHFVPVAEETGQISDIDAFALHRACATVAAWPVPDGERPMVLSVNVSARRFADPRLPGDVRRVLDDTGFPPDRLYLELTESVLLDDLENAVETMGRLVELGVRIAVDDFGTGYSSLQHLKRFPIGVLKIDRSFVDGLGEDRDDEVIVSAVIGLAAALGVEVIGEGVETERQARRLVELGCSYAQGYLYGKPVNPVAASKLAGGTFLTLPDLTGAGPATDPSTG